MIGKEAIVAQLERLVPESIARQPWMRPRYPLLGVELREDAVVVARLTRRGGRYQLAGHSRKPLPPGLLSAALMRLQLADATHLSRLVGEALALAGAQGAQRISLALPDTVARVFLVDVQELPPSRSQALELIRLRVKKSVPFKLEESRLSWQVLGPTEDGRVQVLVVLAPEETIQPLESLLESQGYRTGLIDLASLNLFNALRAGKQLEGRGGDLALLNATPSYFSVMILRGSRLIFYRAKNYHVQGGFQGEESLRVVGRELRTTLSYYQDHLLGAGITQLIVRVAGISTEGILEVARTAECGEVRLAELADVLSQAHGLGEDAAPDLLPAVGLAMRRAS